LAIKEALLPRRLLALSVPCRTDTGGSRAQSCRRSKEHDMTQMHHPPSQADSSRSFMQSARVDAPSDADCMLMASLGIGFESGVYRFEGYRYDRLGDAVTYARLAKRRQLNVT